MDRTERAFSAVVLAAGMSRRMGRLKMLLPFGERPMLARVIESLQASRAITSITVVTGHAEQEIRSAVGEYGCVAWVHNPDHAAGGMLSSIKAGVGGLPDSCEAFFLVLGDQPTVRAETIEALEEPWRPVTSQIVVPTYGGKRGHPVLISARLVPEILALAADETLRTMMTRHENEIAEAPVPDPATVQDVDTPEDYEAALLRWRELEL